MALGLIRRRRGLCLSNIKLVLCFVAGAFFMGFLQTTNHVNNLIATEHIARVTSDPLAILKTSIKNGTAVHKANTPATPLKAAIDKDGCPDTFAATFDENLRVISEYPRSDDVARMLRKIKGNRTMPSTMMTSFPVIATAASSGFFRVTQALLKSIHLKLLPKYKDVKIVYYDMGLTNEQLTELNKYCKCEVRRFPFEDFPPHFKTLKTYAWKPVIVQTLLMEFGWVWWMDSSVRFVTDDLDSALQYSKDNHILFFTYGPSLNVAYQTDLQTMQFLKEDPCKFRPFGEIEATFVLFHHDDVTSVLVEAWCACALTQNCIAPPGTGRKLGCNAAVKRDGRCHRFDQAVLGILIRRLYHAQNDYPLVENPFRIHQIKRGHSEPYFDDLRSGKIHLQ